ncbi:MAG: class I SAM-dependent methyltransferase [Inquilinaceae bacterium]
METERQVAAYYAREGLERTILDALRGAGKDIDALVPSDLSGVDEFHLGWRAQTVELAKELGLSPGMDVLDIGAGIGGPARYFADVHGCIVTGVDLTAEYVATASALTRRCGLADRVSFRQASAMALPFDPGRFDVVTLIHVGMNVADKLGLFTQVRRVLKPGGRFGVYDVMRIGSGDLTYPMPWAGAPETSFVEPPDTYRRLLRQAGFEIERERDRRTFTLEMGQRMREDAAKHGPPPLTLGILMGPSAPQRLGNVMGALGDGVLAPIEMIARAG